MKNIIKKIRHQLDLRDLKGAPFEDLAYLFRFILIFTIIAVTVLIIKGLLWIVQ